MAERPNYDLARRLADSAQDATQATVAQTFATLALIDELALALDAIHERLDNVETLLRGTAVTRGLAEAQDDR